MHLKSWLKPISKNVRSLPIQNSCFVYQPATSAFTNSRFQSGKTNYTWWLDWSINDVVTGVLFLINSTYALLCEQQIEVSPEIERGKCDTDERMRNFSIEQLSIISNMYVVGGGWWCYCLWEKQREKYSSTVEKETDCSSKFLWMRHARKTWLHWDLMRND